jgi:L-seryl-tRNA(Ser) seleniumtransferase
MSSMPVKNKTELLRHLPSVDELLRSPELAPSIERDGRAAAASAARVVLENVRKEIASGSLDEQGVQLAINGIAQAVQRELRRALGHSLQKVINATGVILHTNLGRAPLSGDALDHLVEVSAGYSNLEFDLTTGERGRRDVHVQRLFQRLFSSHSYTRSTAEIDQEGTHETIVVNNCAAAVLLALNTFGDGGEVIVSRGELVEIGGSFRIPEIMAKSGGVLREVGTTNRTRIADYESAITTNTRLLLRVHRSNFAMVGFTEQPSLTDLVKLGRKHRLPVMEDLGNGLLVNLAGAGINGEYGIHESLAAGVDVLCASGDKLLGGPQAGLIIGRKELVRRMRSNPLFRALRVDKLTYAAMEATLLAYAREDFARIPALRMIYMSASEVRSRAESVIAALGIFPDTRIQMIEGKSIIGGGTAPTATLPTYLVAITSEKRAPQELQSTLRQYESPIITRVEDDALLLDLRTVFIDEVDALIASIREALS